MQNQQPLSNLQLELLTLFSRNVTEHDLVQIKSLIALYFAEKATAEADKIWDEKQMTPEFILNNPIRTPYKSQNQ